jgi:hypothetical protein
LYLYLRISILLLPPPFSSRSIIVVVTEIDSLAAPGSPLEKPKAKAATSLLTKGKWLKITRKGLLITAMTRTSGKGGRQMAL